jgi:hypothetical protein
VLVELRAMLPDLADEVVAEVWEHLPGYEGTHMRRSDLEQVVLPNLTAALDALAAGRRPAPDELRRAEILGEGRALQGVPIDGVMQSWRTAERLLLDRLLLAGAGLEVGRLREATRHLGAVFDELAGASLAAYRRIQDEVTVHFDRLTTDLVAWLVGAEHVDPEEVAARARLIEVDPERGYQAAALGLRPAEPVALVRARRHVLAQIGARTPGRILAGAHRDHVVLLVPAWDGQALRPALQRALVRPELDAPAVCGLGEPQPRLADVGASCAQALAALDVGLHDGRPRRVLAYADVLPDVLLLHNRDTARRLVASRLGPLLDRPALVETLRAYLAAGLSVRGTAAALGVHHNTVAYRLRTIRERTGRDLSAALAEPDLLLALRALDLHGPPPWPAS